MRLAGVADAESIGGLLHDFNSEFEEPTPGPARLAERVAYLLNEDHATILLAGSGPDGLAVLRFRRGSGARRSSATWPSCMSSRPARPRPGTRLMRAAIALARERGADQMDLGTGEGDVARGRCMRASASPIAIVARMGR